MTDASFARVTTGPVVVAVSTSVAHDVRKANRASVRLAGVMATVLVGGEVRPGDPIVVEPPEGRPEPLAPV